MFLFFNDMYMFIAAVLEDESAARGTAATITCTISGLSENTPVVWIDPDNNEISESDTENYVINQGTYVFFSKASTLKIEQSKLDTLPSSSTFKCQLKSAQYPTYSPNVVKEMRLTLLDLSN